MKKFLSILMIALIASFAITSCGGESAGGGDVAVEDAPVYNSSYFADVMSSNTGEFVGLELGDSRETVKSKLSTDAFDDETESYLYYYWELDENQYYLDLYFDEGDKLNSIDGYVYFYDADGNYDGVEAAAFYKDMQLNFVTKYGAEEEVVEDGYTYTSWYFDAKDVEVGLDNGEVYWYIYSYDDMEM
jgi:hypothetical protein